MRANDKIYISKYLKDLNERTGTVNPITCKDLAERCEVTTATITNLRTSSKFYLLYRIAEEIYDAYYRYFLWEESKDRAENPDELVYPRNEYYVLMQITSYYTDEWING